MGILSEKYESFNFNTMGRTFSELAILSVIFLILSTYLKKIYNTNFSKKLPMKVFQPMVFLICIQHEFRIINDT